jgi:energy-coupling factor transporter ATP-binding protein EcfA2
MAAPTILFLDEPTSGLDASSALLVMKSLKHLVEKEGVTIVSVIHQPRKFIFDLFDSLILLGVGGRMVYHGAIDQSEQYFNRLHYKLPEGESVADWLIDISSGRLEPDCQVASCRKTEQIISRKSKRNLFAGGFAGVSKLDMKPSESLGDKKSTIKFAPELKEEDEKEENQRTEDEMIEKPAGQIARVSRENSLKLDDETEISEGSMEADPLSRSTTNFEFAGRCVTDDAIVGAKGVTTGKVVQAFEEAKGRRGWLYTEWETHFLRLGGEEKKLYEVPNSYALPDDVIKPSFWYQLVFQFRRACIVAYRNRFSKFIDACIIIGAIVVITALDGIAEITYDEDPDVAFEIMVRPTEDDVDDLFAGLFRYSLTRQITYPLKVGIILSTLMGLTATKVLTSKRLEFFREAGSGYNINGKNMVQQSTLTPCHEYT